jgi:TolB-like protein/tRNA A-37 threonylcarbamoyl transferase component Bud32/Tfp pilus assembly protein PilF
METSDTTGLLGAALAGRYRIETELGAGAMATVFRARDLRHDRDVALKVLRSELAESLGRERFLREIRLAARLNHPHILPLHDSGDANGFLYYVMPLMEGHSLRDRLARECPLPVDLALRIGNEVADALDYAHRHDVVHRDIKPENILLHEGHALVADFGIGKALAAAGASATLTQFGLTVGTPAYMSPEQAAGEDIDGRSDLFALGCVLYEMLVGQPPFTGGSVQAVLAKRFVHTPPDVTATRPTVPPSIGRAVARLLAKTPEERFSTGALVVDALRSSERAQSAAPVAARPEQSIAVLPFTNMSADPDNEFFSDGITEDLIGALTRVPGLKVAARASSFAFKRRDEELRVIGERLGVRTVLQGSVRRAGNRIRVTAQLMNAHDGFQLWSDHFDRDLDDIFALQDELARAIVERLELTLGLRAAEPLVTPPTDNFEAYQLYLRGREAVQQRSAASMRRGVEFFRQALARDPDYARAYVGLAEAYNGLGIYQYMPTIQARRSSEEALAAAALADPTLASVHLIRAQRKLYLGSEWGSAGDDLRIALRHGPQDALAHLYFGYWSGLRGDSAARTASVARALELDPLSHFVHSIAALSYMVSRDDEGALPLALKGLALDPNSIPCLWAFSVTAARLGRVEEALRHMTRAVELAQRGPIMLGTLGYILAKAGRRDEALAIRTELLERAEREYVAPVAELHVALGIGDETLVEASLRRNVEAETGPTSLSVVLIRDVEALLEHPTLGALTGQLSLFAGR